MRTLAMVTMISRALYLAGANPVPSILRPQNQVGDRVHLFGMGVAKPAHEALATGAVVFVEDHGQAKIAVKDGLERGQPVPGDGKFISHASGAVILALVG